MTALLTDGVLLFCALYATVATGIIAYGEGRAAAKADADAAYDAGYRAGRRDGARGYRAPDAPPGEAA